MTAFSFWRIYCHTVLTWAKNITVIVKYKFIVKYKPFFTFISFKLNLVSLLSLTNL